MNAPSQPSSEDPERRRVIKVMVASEREAIMRRFRDGLSNATEILVLGPSSIPTMGLLGGVAVYQPDVLLLGQRVLRNTGERAKERLANLPSRPRVLLLCDKPDARIASTVLASRFYGYIGAGEEMGVVVNAIRCIFRGELWVPRLALARALYGPSHARTASDEHTSP